MGSLSAGAASGTGHEIHISHTDIIERTLLPVTLRLVDNQLTAYGNRRTFGKIFSEKLSSRFPGGAGNEIRGVLAALHGQIEVDKFTSASGRFDLNIGGDTPDEITVVYRTQFFLTSTSCRGNCLRISSNKSFAAMGSVILK